MCNLSPRAEWSLQVMCSGTVAGRGGGLGVNEAESVRKRAGCPGGDSPNLSEQGTPDPTEGINQIKDLSQSCSSAGLWASSVVGGTV